MECASYIGIAYHPSIAKLAPYVIYIATVNDIVHVVNIWTTVVVGMNRYIALCRPLEATRLCTSSRAGKHLMCIVLIAIVYRLPTFFNYEINKTADGSAYREPALRNNRLYYYINVSGCDVLFTFLIPFYMSVFFFVRIVIAFRASRRQQLGRHGGTWQTLKSLRCSWYY